MQNVRAPQKHPATDTRASTPRPPFLYVVPPYWQCPKCLWVAFDPRWTLPVHRRCKSCGVGKHIVYAWPGSAGHVYHAVLSRFRDERDWVSLSMSAIAIRSLIEVHESRLLWTIFVAKGCPSRLAGLIAGESRQDFDRLFRSLVGCKAKELLRTHRARRFMGQDRESLRKYRNEFVHGQPEKGGKGNRRIPAGLRMTLRNMQRWTEHVFRELTNNTLVLLKKGSGRVANPSR